MLSQCVLFRGGFSLEAAEQVIDLTAFSQAPWVFDVLQALCEKSLIYRQGEGLSARMNLLLCIREFVQQRQASHTERFATFFLQEAQKRLSQLHTERGADALAWFSKERENFYEVHRLGVLQKRPSLIYNAPIKSRTKHKSQAS